MKNGHCKTRNVGNEGKMKSHNNFKLSFSERSLDLVIGFKFEFDVIWGSLVSLGAQLFKNWSFLV